MPSEKQLLAILEKDTVDTSSWRVDDPKEAKYQMERAEGRLYSLAIPQVDGTLMASHVTDDPLKVIDLLKANGDFYAREGDLCGGLYVSAVPHFWEGRSNRKWDFLPKLSPESRGVLYQSIYDRLVDQIKAGYITPGEFENAQGVMAQAMTMDYWQILDIVANQPFNIDIPKMAKDLGLATPFEPHRVRVDFVGRYLEFNTKNAIEANEALLKLRHGSLEGVTRLDLCNMLKSYGWDGVFTKASMGTNPELVIWNGDKIVSFGDWVQSSPALSGRKPQPLVIYDPDLPRFEAWVSYSRKVADIGDTKDKKPLMIMEAKDVSQLKSLIEGVLAGIARFEDPRGEQYGSVPAYYTYTVYLKLRAMDELDLRELLALVNRLSETIV